MNQDRSVWLRSDGRYETRITVDGTRHSIFGNSEEEVKKKLKDKLWEIEKGNILEKNMNIGTAISNYIYKNKLGTVKPTSFDRVESTYIHHIKGFPIAKKKIASVKPEDLYQHLFNECTHGYSWSTVKKTYDLLKEFFTFATVNRMIQYNPMVQVRMPHKSMFSFVEKDIEILTPDEIKRVINIASVKYNSGNLKYRYGEAIVLALLTGVRSGELRAIKLSDVDFENKTLSICRNAVYAKDRSKDNGIKHMVGTTKTNKSVRTIPLNERAIIAISNMKELTWNKNTDFLICTQTGERVLGKRLQITLDSMLRDAGIGRHLSLHNLRDTFATTILKEAGEKGQVKEVSEMLGHSRVSTTLEYYIKTSFEDKRGLVDAFNSMV